ncbi:MAG: NADPH-dependent F420 reductase [Parvularculaceae bacterium]
MKIAIIGTGAVGSALARGWSRAGLTLILGARDPNDAGARALAAAVSARLAAPQAAATEADIVVLALPWSVAESAVKALGDLAGKIVIDCMNPLVMVDGKLGLERGFTTSGAEALAVWAPGARIVKTLNQVGADLMDDAASLTARPVMFMAGDDAAAKKTAHTLIEAIGFEAIDAGPLRQARLLEPLAMVWIDQALVRGAGRDWAFGVLRRKT